VFGGKGEEISFQEFTPGGSELLPASIEKLDALAKGLYERPGLQVEIEGSADPQTDLAALRLQKMLKDFRVQKWKSLRKADQARLSPEAVELLPEERADFLKAARAAAFTPEAVAARAAKTGATNAVASAPRFPSHPAAGNPTSGTRPTDRPERGAAALLQGSSAAAAESRAPAQDLEAEYLQTIEITQSDFAALTTARAERVKDYLVKNGKVEPERIFLTEAGPKGVTLKGSRVYLHLQ